MGAILLWAAISQADWSAPVRISEPGGCQYPQILAQGDTLHVVYTNNHGRPKISYVRSSDGGLTWSSYRVISDTVNTDNTLFPRIMRSNQKLLAVWTANLIYWPGYESVHYSLSTNDGQSWSQDQRIINTDRDNIVYFSASNYDSLVNIVFNSRPQSDTLATYNTRSTNFGSNWSPPWEAKICYQSYIPDQASQGNLIHYVWSGNFNRGETWETYYIRSTDGGLTWSSNIPISSIDSIVSEITAITVNERGNPAISWLDGKYAPPGIPLDVFVRVSFDSGATWQPERQITTNHKALSSDICWANDTIHIVWQDDRFAPYSTIYYSFSSDSAITWSPEERLVYDSSAASYPAIMASSNGKAYVVFYEYRPYPGDTSGLYFTRNPAFPDAINEPDIPDKTGELWAYPNPFNSSTIISYSNLMEGGEISIYNLMGQKIKTFTIESGKEAKIIWDATDASGKTVCSGIYFAKIGNNDNSNYIKLIYLK